MFFIPSSYTRKYILPEINLNYSGEYIIIIQNTIQKLFDKSIKACYDKKQ